MLSKEQFFGMYIGGDCIINGVKRSIMNGSLITELQQCNIARVTFDCKLILRPFEYGEMTKAEIEHYERLCGEEDEPMSHIVDTPQSIEYLISIGIDIFNLKEKGYAIYEEDLKC